MVVICYFSFITMEKRIKGGRIGVDRMKDYYCPGCKKTIRIYDNVEKAKVYCKDCRVEMNKVKRRKK